MVNWLDSRTLLSQAASLQKLTLVFTGIYFYEFSLSLPHDWKILKKPYDRPVHLVGNGLYLVCRYLVFASCISACLLAASANRAFSCEALVKTYAVWPVL
ncbi:hypothetical protein PENSPDRAFT_646785 [Peniophora sp. CONT]|nr:hypothetical protein PENSPDRAFT_646785 [Peniophora sp. CONT]